MADAAEVAAWASMPASMMIMEEEKGAGAEREPEEDDSGWGYYRSSE